MSTYAEHSVAAPERPGAEQEPGYDVTIVMPCLNEAESLAPCIEKAKAAIQETGPPANHTRVAAVGPATAEALVSAGVAVDFVPSAYTTVALATELPGPPSRVCVVRAEAAGPDLETILADRGFEVERVNAYRTEPSGHHLIVEALDDGVDAVALTSASITEAFADAAGHPPDTRGAAVFSIGPATTAACRRAGLAVRAEAGTHTIPALVATIADTMEA